MDAMLLTLQISALKFRPIQLDGQLNGFLVLERRERKEKQTLSTSDKVTCQPNPIIVRLFSAPTCPNQTKKAEQILTANSR